MFQADVFRVLIGSPSDTAAQRLAVREAIVDWNDLNAEPSRVVLVPIMWEMSATPDLAAPAQDVINTQIVDDVDMLVAVFWTRLGTPTANASSGTTEEIQRLVDRGVPVMVYFSNQPAILASVDTGQHAALLDYKKSLDGLYAEFDTTDALIRRLQKDLTRTVRVLGEKKGTVAEAATAESDDVHALSVYRAEFRGAVARFGAEWGGLREDPTAVDASRSSMGMLAQGLSNYLAALASLSEDAPSSDLYNKILLQAQKASQLARFKLYLDGGRSWREFQEGVDGIVESLTGIAGGEWTL